MKHRSNYGVPLTEEHKRKVSEALKGHGFSEETLEKMRAAKLGKKQTPEHVANNKAATTGKKRTQEARERMSAAQKGRTLSAEHRAKIGAAQSGKPNLPRTAETRAKLSASIKAAYQNGLRERRREEALSRWRDPEKAAKWAQSMPRKPTKPEKAAMVLLGSDWRYVGDGQLWINGRNPDFVHVTEKRLVEVYGRYWHRNDDGSERVALYAEAGYDCRIIWDDDPELRVVAKAVAYG